MFENNHGNRGQTHVLGFALMTGLVLTSFGLWQADVVPHQNERIEQNHAEAVGGELSSFRDAMGDVSRSGTAGSATIQLGTTYAKRPIALNPPDPPGRIGTDATLAVSVKNFQTIDERGWTGAKTHTFATKDIQYQSYYNVRSTNVRYGIEYGALYKRYGDHGARVVTGEDLISGSRINILLVGGSFTKNGLSGSVDIQPVSTSSSVLMMEPDGGKNPEFEFETRMPKSAWQQILDGESRVTSWTYDEATNPNTVTVKLTASGTYEVHMTKVGFGSPSSPGAYYLNNEDPLQQGIEVGESRQLAVSVRDELGNPVSGVEVNVTIKSGSGTLSDTTVVSDRDGVATAVFTPDTDSKGKIRFDIPPNNAVRHRIAYELGQNPSGVITLTHANQLHTGVGTFDSLAFSDGMTVSREDCSFDIDLSLNCDGAKVLYADFQIRGQDGTYRTIVGLEDSDADGTIETNQVKVVDEGSSETIFYGELFDSRATDLAAGGSVNIFDESNYAKTGSELLSLLGDTDPSCSGCGDISTTFQNPDILVNTMYGRVTLEPT